MSGTRHWTVLIRGDKFLEVEADCWDVTPTGYGKVTFKRDGEAVALIVVSELIAIVERGTLENSPSQVEGVFSEFDPGSSESGSDAAEFAPTLEEIHRLMEQLGSEAAEPRTPRDRGN